VPPKYVLKSYYERNPEFIVTGEELGTSQPLDYRAELGVTEAILVDVLRSAPACVLDRTSFANEAVKRLMNLNTFGVYSTYSPVILHVETDIWSLRGVKVDPAAVQAVREANAQRPREKRLIDHGWTQDGGLWFASRLPENPASLVVGVPGSIKRYVSGRQFEARDDDDLPQGTIRVNDDGNSYGFGPYLRRRGADAGDILIVEFDLADGHAVLRLGDDEVLDEMSPAG
jgi:hypothetical protein